MYLLYWCSFIPFGSGTKLNQCTWAVTGAPMPVLGVLCCLNDTGRVQTSMYGKPFPLLSGWSCCWGASVSILVLRVTLCIVAQEKTLSQELGGLQGLKLSSGFEKSQVMQNLWMKQKVLMR